VVVPDQLRTGVVDPCRYEPRVQRTYGRLGAALASHVIANVTVVPGGILQPPSEGERRSWGIL
jgi:hypothetical protein